MVLEEGVRLGHDKFSSSFYMEISNKSMNNR